MSLFFPSRIARLSYLLRNLVIAVATWPLASIVDEREGAPVSSDDLWFLLLAVILAAYWLAFIVRPRCKDTGIRWGWMFLMLVPIVDIGFGLLLLLKPSKPVLEGIGA